jgi:hypothetical protein
MTTAKSLAVCTSTPDQMAAQGRGGRDRRDPRRRARAVSADLERGRVPPSRGHRGPKQEGSGHGNLGRQRFLDDVAAAAAAAETQANRRRKQTEDASKPETQANRRRKQTGDAKQYASIRNCKKFRKEMVTRQENRLRGGGKTRLTTGWEGTGRRGAIPHTRARIAQDGVPLPAAYSSQ